MRTRSRALHCRGGFRFWKQEQTHKHEEKQKSKSQQERQQEDTHFPHHHSHASKDHHRHTPRNSEAATRPPLQLAPRQTGTETENDTRPFAAHRIPSLHLLSIPSPTLSSRLLWPFSATSSPSLAVPPVSSLSQLLRKFSACESVFLTKINFLPMHRSSVFQHSLVGGVPQPFLCHASLRLQVVPSSCYPFLRHENAHFRVFPKPFALLPCGPSLLPFNFPSSRIQHSILFAFMLGPLLLLL